MNLQGKFLRKKDTAIRFHYEEHGGTTQLKHFLSARFPKSKREVVLVCIGTDRSTGDALGPLIGTKLKRRLPQEHIYGSLQSPVHALNLQETIDKIRSNYEHPFIIGIDACLGKLASVGFISASDGPVRPGAGVNKVLPSIGDMHITGIVNVSGFMQYTVLQNTRLHLVMSMADIIADGLFLSLYRRYRGKHTDLNNIV